MKSFLFIILLFSSSFIFGQDGVESVQSTKLPSQIDRNFFVGDRKSTTIRRNSLYAELGGSGGFASFNYEWNFKTKEQFRWMLRTGISGTYIDKNNGAALIFPVMVHGIYGKTHCVDIGIGQSLSLSQNGVFVRAPLSFGYRLEPEGKRIFYRFSYTPIISYLVDFQWEHWAGVSVGFKLNPRLKR